MISWQARPAGLCLRAFVPIFAGVLLAGSNDRSHSADLKITGQAGQRLYFSDNLDLLPDPVGSVLYSTSSISTTITAALPTLEIELDAGLTYNTYSGSGSAGKSDSLGQNYMLSLTKDTRSTTYSASIGFTVQDAQSSELDDTGLTQIDTNRITTRGTAGIDHAVNRNNRIGIDGTVTSVDFSTETADLTPFFSASLAGTWTHLVNSRITTNVKSSVSLFEPDDGTGSQSVTFRNALGMSVAWTKNLDVSGSGGVHLITRHDDVTPTSTAAGFSGDLDVEYRQKRTTYNLKLSQDVSPSAAGELLTRTSVSASLRHKVNERTGVNLSAGLVDQGGASNGSTTNDRTTFSLSSSIDFQLTRLWQAVLGYDFRHREEGNSNASSNAIYVRVSRDAILLP